MKCLLASVLLEPNRWKPGRPPSLRVSEWSDRAAAAGFDGWELWENHYRAAEAAERGRLETGEMPVTIFNTYVPFDDSARPEFHVVAECARRLRAAGIKFNVGSDPLQFAAYRQSIETFPPGARLLCECHPGTLLETPEAAAAFVATWSDAPFDVIIHPFLLDPQSIARWLHLLGCRVRHAHVQMRAYDDPRRFVALADNASRAQECLAALREGGFDGTFALEFSSPTGGPSDEPEALFAAARRDLDFLREHGLGEKSKPQA